MRCLCLYSDAMGFDNIAVIGERELVLGFRLVGISDVFMSTGQEAVKMIIGFMENKTYGLVLASESIRGSMDKTTLKRVDTSLRPLVVFIPMPGEYKEQESVEALAKRVLGVDIKGLKGA